MSYLELWNCYKMSSPVTRQPSSVCSKHSRLLEPFKDKVKDSSVRAVRLTHCNYGIDYIV